MSKYDITSYTKKDGTKGYFISELQNTVYKYGIRMNISKEIFTGTKEECEAKLKELRKQEK